MEQRPIYVDLDEVLIASIRDPITDLPGDIVVRPDASWFLETLSRYGEVCLLSSAEPGWVEPALGRLGDAAKVFSKVYTLSDLYPIALRLEMIEKVESERDREELHAQVPSILPPGAIFDDYPAGSWMYLLKGLATGIIALDPSLWIQVDPFQPDAPDDGGLRRAFQEFLKRNSGWSKAPRMNGPGNLPRQAVQGPQASK